MDERTRAALAAQTRFKDIRWVKETGSTNSDLLEEAAAGGPDGIVLVTDHQTAGRGRLDRTWEAHPQDGLLVSVLLRPSGLPAERRGLVASAVGLAARQACREVAGLEPDLKWPNDLLSAGGAKLAGILAVSVADTVVVGMGLNVHGGPPGSAFLDDLAGRRVSRARLLEAWLRDLDRRVTDWPAVAAAYRAECATVGRRVSVELSEGRLLEGTAEGVDDLGRLLVRADGGETTALSVGDVTHVR
jgi:BirA family biotin operon repressor/biotin-[acetyl-CoA-carboxylase] ligase